MAPRAPDRPLSRERILHAAVAVADEGGADAITMRAVASHLGVEAMSLYHHVANKDALLDGVVDLVFDTIDLPPRPSDDADWQPAIRARCRSARDVLARHSWALGLVDSRRNPGMITLRHHDAFLGVLRRAGFSVPMAAGAISLLDSYVYGFVLQQVTLPVIDPDELEEVAGGILEHLPEGELPYLTEIILDHALQPDYDHLAEFDRGLDLVLDALEARRG